MVLEMVSLESLNEAVKEVYGDFYRVRISGVIDAFNNGEITRDMIIYISQKQLKNAYLSPGGDIINENEDIDIRDCMYYINTFNIAGKQYVRLKDIDPYLQNYVELTEIIINAVK